MNFLKKAVKNVTTAVNTVNNAVQINQFKDDIAELEQEKQALEKKKLLNTKKECLAESVAKLIPLHSDVLRELQNYNTDGVNLSMDPAEFQQKHAGDASLIYYNKLYHQIAGLNQQMKEHSLTSDEHHLDKQIEDVSKRLDALKDKLRKVREKQFGKKTDDDKTVDEVVVEQME